MENRAGGRSENLGREATIQALLKEEVLLLIRPKSVRSNASPSPLIPKELNIQWLPNEVLLKIFSYLSLKEMITVLSKVCKRFQGAKYLCFFSPLVPSKRKKNILLLLSQFCSVCTFFKGSVFFELKSKYISLKKSTN